MKMKKYLLFSFLVGLSLLWGSGIAFAQTTVSGTIIDENSQPLPGVTILVKGTTTGTTTDIDGKYKLSVKTADAILVYSYVGYKSQEVAVGSQATIDIQLELDAATLEEVVVIGYGEIEAKDATGAVNTVDSKSFNQGVISSPEQLFQGKAAGVQITSTSGEPGAGVNIRIRGTSSVRGGNNPLFVVDGIPLSGGDVSGGGQNLGRGSSSAKNPLNFINPNDIASIDILKDASATAIYGSRGANGVVIITTKSGKGLSDQPGQLSFSSSVSVSQVANRFDLLDASEFVSAVTQFGGTPVDNGADTDWQDVVMRTAVSNTQNLAYSNGYSSGDYRVSLGYSDQNGIVNNTGLERLSARINWNQRLLDDKLKLNLQSTISRINDQATLITDDAGFEGDLLGSMIISNPTWVNDPDILPDNTVAHPGSILEYYDDNTKTDRMLLNFSAAYEITDDLNFKVNTGIDRSTAQRSGGFSKLLQTGNGIGGNGRAFIVNTESRSDLIEAFANYDKKVGKVKINALLGYSYQRFENQGSTLLGWGLNSETVDGGINDLQSTVDALQNQASGDYQQLLYQGGEMRINRLFPEPITERQTVNGSLGARSAAYDTYNNVDELQSYFGRVNVSIDSKYLFTATLRADGSSRFGSDNRYGIFPSLAAAWRISDEEFMSGSVDNLKLRVGYGITGNQEIPHNLYQQRSRYSGPSIDDGGNVNSVYGPVSFANPGLKWEETAQTNVGLDLGIMGGRLNFTLDYYNKVTTDLLIRIASAQPAAQPFSFENVDADVINRGVELTVNAVVVDKGDFGFTLNANAAYNKNVVENLTSIINTGLIRGQGLTGAFAQRIAEGEPLFSYFLREFSGYNDSGIATYSGEGDKQVFVGKSPIPKWNVGFSTNFDYKDFSLTAIFNGQFGHYIYNNTTNAFFTAGSIAGNRNVIRDVVNSGESAANAPDVSTRFLESGDFLRMQTLSLGYNFNMSNTDFIKDLRLSLNAQNLFVITNYSGLDPEVSTNAANGEGVPSLNIDYTAYPRARTFTLSLNATF